MSTHGDLSHYEDQLSQSDSRLEQEAKHNAALRQIVEGMRALAATSPPKAVSVAQPQKVAEPIEATEPVDEVERPSSIVAGARQIFRETGKPWRTQDLHLEIERRDWFSPDIKNPIETVRAAVKRLQTLGEISRVGFGTYVWAETMPLDLEPPPPAANGVPESSPLGAVERTEWVGTGAKPPGGAM